MNFSQKHAIITGGSSGIGKAIAKQLAAEGAYITIIARTQATLDAAKAEIEAVKTNKVQQVIALSANVSQRLEIEKTIQKSIERIGPPDLLITSAGIAHPGYFDALPIDVFERTMAINYFGSLYSIRAVLPIMKHKRQGHIVMISSGAGLVGLYGYTTYSPTKFALKGLAESLRGELKLFGIRTSIVYPPDTDTPQLENENKTKPLETKMITTTAKTWRAEDVASEIIQGVGKGDFSITPGLEMTLLEKFHSLLAPLLNFYFDWLVTKARR